MKKKIKIFIQSNRWLKCVPNFLTVCNALCGFSAILIALYYYQQKVPFGNHNYEAIAIGACVILFAMVFDALDGAAARIFNAASMHGIQMDSLADMTTFGTAPAVLTAIMVHNYLPQYMENIQLYQYIGIWFFCGLYLACAALRLATYNVHAFQQKKSGDKFSGLPTPAAAAAICSLIIFYAWCKESIIPVECLYDQGPEVIEKAKLSNHHYEMWAKTAVHIIPFYAAGLGLLMVSSFQYTHAFKKIQQIRKNPKQIACVILIGVLICIWPVWTLMGIVNLYLLSAPASWFIGKLGLFRAKSTPSVPPVPPPSLVDGLS